MITCYSLTVRNIRVGADNGVFSKIVEINPKLTKSEVIRKFIDAGEIRVELSDVGGATVHDYARDLRELGADVDVRTGVTDEEEDDWSADELPGGGGALFSAPLAAAEVVEPQVVEPQVVEPEVVQSQVELGVDGEPLPESMKGGDPAHGAIIRVPDASLFTESMKGYDPEKVAQLQASKPFVYEGTFYVLQSISVCEDCTTYTAIPVERRSDSVEGAYTYRKQTWAPTGPAVLFVVERAPVTPAEPPPVSAPVDVEPEPAIVIAARALAARLEALDLPQAVEALDQETDRELLTEALHLFSPGSERANMIEGRIRWLDQAQAALGDAPLEVEVLAASAELQITRPLTDADFVELGRRMAAAQAKARRVKADLDRISKRLKGEIEVALADAAEAGDIVEAGERTITVEVRHELRPDGRVHLVRLDTGEVVLVRDMSDAERQRRLDFGKPKTDGVDTDDANDGGWADEG